MNLAYVWGYGLGIFVGWWGRWAWDKTVKGLKTDKRPELHEVSWKGKEP